MADEENQTDTQPKPKRATAKVSVGVRTPEDDAKATAAQIEAEVATGKELVEEDGAKWLIERSARMTIKTRIA